MSDDLETVLLAGRIAVACPRCKGCRSGAVLRRRRLATVDGAVSIADGVKRSTRIGRINARAYRPTKKRCHVDKETFLKLLKDKDIREQICALVMADLPRRFIPAREPFNGQTPHQVRMSRKYRRVGTPLMLLSKFSIACSSVSPCPTSCLSPYVKAI